MTDAPSPSSIHSEVASPRPIAEHPASEEFARARLRRFRKLIFFVQFILLAAHGVLYATWVAFHPALDVQARLLIGLATVVAAVSFVAASLLTWSHFNWAVRAFYTVCAVWIGVMDFGVFASCACWIFLGITRLAGLRVDPALIADGFFSAGLLVALYGVINGAWVRVNHVTVKLPNLPEEWRGREAALVSDLHLGHVRNLGFMRRVVGQLNQLRPDVVFICGDMYDGTLVDVEALAQPWSALAAPWGALFICGNHEEFTHRARYLRAVAEAGVRVLNNEKVDLQGMQIIGVHFRETTDPVRYRTALQNAAISRERASILLVHAPHRMGIAEDAGVSLQLSGHTHGGQFPPGSWVASRIYGPFVHGLNRLGKMQVFTSWGVGTWGPPLRVGTKPEIVLIRFE